MSGPAFISIQYYVDLPKHKILLSSYHLGGLFIVSLSKPGGSCEMIGKSLKVSQHCLNFWLKFSYSLLTLNNYCSCFHQYFRNILINPLFESGISKNLVMKDITVIMKKG